jgi:hypothetical protein
MSKEVTDVVNRLNGILIGLQAAAAKVARPPGLPSAPNTTFEQQAFPAPPLAPPTREDYEMVKRLVEEAKGLAASIGEYVDKELKIPQPGESASPSPAAEGSAKTK